MRVPRVTKNGRMASTAFLVVVAAIPVFAFVSVPSWTSGDTAKAVDGDSPTRPKPDRAGLSLLPPGTRVLVRAVDEATPRAEQLLYELAADGSVRQVGRQACKRVHSMAGGPGLCLALADNGIDYDGMVLDERYRPSARFQLPGVPDRARVSPDGRYGAYTTFDRESSEGYFETTGEFSTDTRIVDMASGRQVLDVEALAVTRGGKSFENDDEELWGVTFASGDRFYATLATGSEHFLIEADVSSGRGRVVGRNVECPALSPDGTHIAYKRRIGNTNRWRLHVRNLATGSDTALAETASIDDQPEWIGDDLIAYSDDRTVYAVTADGSGRPHRLAQRATSPTFVRP